MDDSARADFLRLTSWMGENVMLASGIYRTTDRQIAVDPVLYLHEDGSVARKARFHVDPPKHDSWLLSTVAALACCCYIDALGKVLLHGSGSNLNHFREFIARYMPDFMEECKRRGLPYSVDLLHRLARCGFVHQFAHKNLAWGRSILSREYWFALKPIDGQDHEIPGVNVDHLVRGFVRGLSGFRKDFVESVERGEQSYEDFFTSLAK